MIRSIIVDDEENSRTTIRSFLEKYCPSIEVLAEAEGVKKGLELIERQKPDVIFLDIEMGDGTGFDLIEKLPHKNFDVVFITAYNQYAIKAFRYSAIDYLLKPVNPEELIQAVKKLQDANRINEIEKKLDALLLNRRTLQKVVISSMQGFRLEDVRDILFCESDNYYTHIHLRSGEKLLASKPLKEFDKMLCDQGFFRVHQKFLVSIQDIKSYNNSDGGTIQLKTGQTLMVSRRKRSELLKLLSF